MFIDFPKSEAVVKGLENIRLPEMARMQQIFEDDKIEDLKGHLLAQMTAELSPAEFTGKRIAITAGSRGIPNLDLMIRTLCDQLKEWGAQPFIVPAMGSHGNAVAEGQTEYLAGFNITEESMGVPLLSSMDVVEYGTLEDGTPCYCDKYAFEADGIVLLNKVKPHTEFRGPYESGLCKMVAIGLGNHLGASEFHARGFDTFAKRIPEVAEVFLKTGHCAFGVAVVQNAYDEISELEVIRPENILTREPELLEIAKRRIAGFKGKDVDVLIIDEIGKNISGAGHDPNVTGRNSSGLPGFETVLNLKRLFIRGVTEQSHHNGIGIGLADVSTLRCVRSIDWAPTFTNLLNAVQLAAAKVPFYMDNDRDALLIAIRQLTGIDYNKAKVVRIRNTQHMTEILVSRSYWETVCDRPDVKLLSDFEPMKFDEEGYFVD